MRPILLSLESLGSVRQTEPLILTPDEDLQSLLSRIKHAQFGICDRLHTAAEMLAALGAAQLLSPIGPIDPALVFGSDTSFAQVQEKLACATAPNATPLFVSAHREERQQARLIGLLVSPHLSLVPAVQRYEPIYYCRVAMLAQGAGVPDAASILGERDRDFVPICVSGTRSNVVFGIASRDELVRLAKLQLDVAKLGAADQPLATEAYLVRADDSSTPLPAVRGDWLLCDCDDALLIAIPAGHSIDECHYLASQHGHCRHLAPDFGLLRPNAAPSSAWNHPALARDGLDATVMQALRSIDVEELDDTVARYSGGRPLLPGQTARIHSRHVRHPDNRRAVEALLADLKAQNNQDLRISRHRFRHEGAVLESVVAELRGTSDEIVMISAHLDSTAGKDADPLHTPAPGADDDASGMAAVLAAARTLAKLSQKQPPRRTLRFALWNAEEQGMVGSGAYARALHQEGAPIAGVFQLDMIGMASGKAPFRYEIHAGCSTSADVTESSRQLAELCRDVATVVAPKLAAPEIFADAQDPADERSDHSSFQVHGYPACVLSEDFFGARRPDNTPEVLNPDYHSMRDKTISAEFAVELTRVVTGAAWLLANADAVARA